MTGTKLRMIANKTIINAQSQPLNKIELIALLLFSAMMFFLLSQVFYLAHKYKQIETAEYNLVHGIQKPETKSMQETQTQTRSPKTRQETSVIETSTINKQVIENPKEEKIEPVTELVNEIFSDSELIALENQKIIDRYCETVGEKLGSVNVQDCKNAKLKLSGVVSNQSRPLTFRDFITEVPSETTKEKIRILLVGGIHGDEFSGVSISFKWLNKLANDYSSSTNSSINDYHWRVIPILNPDGLLQPDGQSKRMNANDVDLNRNFPTEDWDEFAHKYWIDKRGRDPRRYPGESGGSEIETQWIVQQINEFKPHAVISIHAPYGIVDSDGPIEPPKKLGPLQLKILGTYPGSMGRYVGVQKNIPMLTVELKRAGTMPTQKNIDLIWTDIQKWINDKVLNKESVAAMQSIRHEDEEHKDTIIDKKAGD